MPEGFPVSQAINLNLQHLTVLGNSLESSYSSCVSYNETEDLKTFWSRDLRENLRILKK